MLPTLKKKPKLIRARDSETDPDYTTGPIVQLGNFNPKILRSNEKEPTKLKDSVQQPKSATKNYYHDNFGMKLEKTVKEFSSKLNHMQDSAIEIMRLNQELESTRDELEKVTDNCIKMRAEKEELEIEVKELRKNNDAAREEVNNLIQRVMAAENAYAELKRDAVGFINDYKPTEDKLNDFGTYK